jgi:hypothetical protein
MALFAFIASCGFLVTCGLTAPVGIYLALRARREIAGVQPPPTNAWMVPASFAIGGLGSFSLVMSVVAMLVPSKPHPPVAIASSSASTATSAPTSSAAAASTSAAVVAASTASASATSAGADAWSSPDVTKIEDGDGMKKAFWFLFDDLAKEHDDDAVNALKKDHPATWQAEVPSLHTKLAADRKSGRAGLRTSRFLYVFLVDSPTYDVPGGAFHGEVPGLIHVEGEDEHSWFFALGSAPTVKRDTTAIPASDTKRAASVFEYAFVGGRPAKWSFKYPPDQADAFVKRFTGLFGDRLQVDLLLIAKQAVFNHDRPSSAGFVGAGSDNTTGAGRAVVVDLVAWRVKSRKTGEVFASFEPSK